MEIVSGALGQVKVNYVAPPADIVEAEMSAFLEWFNGSYELDPLIKAAIAHLWFVAVHTFGVGNGRITRATADMTLARGAGGARRGSTRCRQHSSDPASGIMKHCNQSPARKSSP
jgi:Fic family protein